MKVTRSFVKGFLGVLLLVVILNIVSLIFGFYNSWMGYTAVGLVLLLFFLIFRKHKGGFIRFLAWTLPILFILFVLYMNFHPFGFHKDYTITISSDGKVISSSSQAYLQDLKGKMITNLSDVYDYGQINLIVNPKAVLRNATINVSIINTNESNVYLAKTSFNPNTNKWDYFWNFTKGVPNPLEGTAKYNKNLGCVYFNASLNQTLSYPNSSDMFENGSFIVYAKWKPENTQGKAQQIIGHYNWELWQNNDSVRFMVGRMENSNGSMPSISLPINESFFGKTHSALTIYEADKKNSAGYIELWVDGNFAGRTVIDNKSIWAGYNSNRDLSFGWSPHNYGNNSYFAGCVYQADFDYGSIKYLKEESFSSNNKTVQILVLGSGKPQEIKLSINQ